MSLSGKAPPRPSPPLLHEQQAWLMACAFATVLPHLAFAPLWLGGTTLGLFLVRFFLWKQRLPAMARPLLLLLVLGYGVGVFAEFGRFFGREPGIALLLALACLKLFEARTRRDGVSLVFLCFFLEMALFLQNQSVATALATAGTVLVATATLSSLTHAARGPAEMLRLAGSLLLQATPFMVLLFLLFPRIQGPLWGLPADARGGVTGLSDTMSPGAISQLSRSEAVAFRVKVEGPVPPLAQLYWRGPVLSRFDGRTWREARKPTPLAHLPYAVPAGMALRYTVVLEPLDRPWLFALELPVSLPREGLMSPDYRLLVRDPVRSRTSYSLASRPGLMVGLDEDERVLKSELQLPEGVDVRARTLAEGWRGKGGGGEAILQRALEFFRTGQFIYTLSPPPLGEDEVDQFLFDTRQGFCEHFAGSFVFLMRAAGVPARVVTGYQGGEVNPVDGYLTVRQSDAHAWAEVWLPGRGWGRVDPTAAAAPIRIERGLSAAVPAGEALPLAMRLDQSWIRGVRWTWEALANGWNRWVLGYNQVRQKQLLGSLGMPDSATMIAVLAVLTAAFMAGLMAWTLRRRHAQDPALAAWNRLSEKLARLGLGRLPDEGPLAWRDRVAEARPELAGIMAEMVALYIARRYGREPKDQDLRRLVRTVAAFKT